MRIHLLFASTKCIYENTPNLSLRTNYCTSWRSNTSSVLTLLVSVSGNFVLLSWPPTVHKHAQLSICRDQMPGSPIHSSPMELSGPSVHHPYTVMKSWQLTPLNLDIVTKMWSHARLSHVYVRVPLSSFPFTFSEASSEDLLITYTKFAGVGLTDDK